VGRGLGRGGEGAWAAQGAWAWEGACAGGEAASPGEGLWAGASPMALLVSAFRQVLHLPRREKKATESEHSCSTDRVLCGLERDQFWGESASLEWDPSSPLPYYSTFHVQHCSIDSWKRALRTQL